MDFDLITNIDIDYKYWLTSHVELNKIINNYLRFSLSRIYKYNITIKERREKKKKEGKGEKRKIENLCAIIGNTIKIGFFGTHYKRNKS